MSHFEAVNSEHASNLFDCEMDWLVNYKRITDK